MGDRIQRLNQVAQDGDIDAEIQRLNGIAQQGDIDAKIQGLNAIAQKGNIDAFYKIIRGDVKLLEHIDESPFVDTPLHESASAGKIPFSIEMMKLRPSFISKPNPDGQTPIYLALKNGYAELVRQLLQHNADLVRVKGKECMTPLHNAATKIGREDPTSPHYEAKTKDYLALLENFLSVCPDSITDMTTRNETALHVALRNNNLEAFKFLVGWLLRKWSYWRKILGQKDVEGNTVLHVAVSKNQTQAVSHLLALGPRFVNINEKNLEGNTALDILDGQGVDNSEMRVILKRAGALKASSLPTVASSHEHYLRLPGICEAAKILFIGNQVRERISGEKRNALLVVAALLVTVTFQAMVSPPDGIWQDDLLEPNTTTAALIPPKAAGFVMPMQFLLLNSLIFFTSIAVMVLLVPPGEIVGRILALVSTYLCICYSFLILNFILVGA